MFHGGTTPVLHGVMEINNLHPSILTQWRIIRIGLTEVRRGRTTNLTRSERIKKDQASSRTGLTEIKKGRTTEDYELTDMYCALSLTIKCISGRERDVPSNC